MKKISFIFLVVFMLLAAVSCSRVPPGHVGLKVDLLGSEKGGIDELGVGRYHIGVNEELHKFPTFNQNYVWTADRNEGSPNDESFTFSVDGLPVNIDVGIEYNLEAGKIKDIFQKYRKGVDELTDVTIRNAVRDGFNSYSKNYDMDSLISGGMDELVANVEQHTREVFQEVGINIVSISLVSAPRYPESVVRSIESKIRATQEAVQREYELRETEAESKKKIAEANGIAEAKVINAKADAEVKTLLNATYTDAVLQAMWIEKWDGVLPQTMPGDSSFMMNLK